MAYLVRVNVIGNKSDFEDYDAFTFNLRQRRSYEVDTLVSEAIINGDIISRITEESEDDEHYILTVITEWLNQEKFDNFRNEPSVIEELEDYTGPRFEFVFNLP